MHSTTLRGSDFTVKSHNLEISHTGYCRRFSPSAKLGIYSPNGIEAVGAANLILLFITSFYDNLRSKSEDFHAYPDFYTFQCNKNLTDYGMLDIYPIDKNILIHSGVDALFDEVVKKELNILILPEKSDIFKEFSDQQLSILHKSLDVCFLFGQSGEVQSANLSIETNNADISEWVAEIKSSNKKQITQSQLSSNLIVQSFQEISLKS